MNIDVTPTSAPAVRVKIDAFSVREERRRSHEVKPDTTTKEHRWPHCGMRHHVAEYEAFAGSGCDDAQEHRDVGVEVRGEGHPCSRGWISLTKDQLGAVCVRAEIAPSQCRYQE